MRVLENLDTKTFAEGPIGWLEASQGVWGLQERSAEERFDLKIGATEWRVGWISLPRNGSVVDSTGIALLRLSFDFLYSRFSSEVRRILWVLTPRDAKTPPRELPRPI